MKKLSKILYASVFASVLAVTLIGCNRTPEGETTADIVAKASKMTLAELEAAAEAEMTASNDTFKLVGLTSAIKRGVLRMAEQYDWLTEDKIYVNNSYKDYALLTALEQADDSYFADYALIQDARSLSDYLEAGITVNYVPSDYKELGLPEHLTYPLAGIHFNKVFYVNDRIGPDFHNVWQISGSEEDPEHLGNLSFQTPVTEQINMSFLLSLYSPENQTKLATAYKKYYGKDWVPSDKFTNIGEEYVDGLIKNVSRWHTSDGTVMKVTNAHEEVVEGEDPFVIYGAFAKMKDCIGYTSSVYEDVENTMELVKWDLEIEGFNGFMYAMYSQVIKNAKHPYTASLFARYMLTPDFYENIIYNADTPNKAGEPSNMYGYYFPANVGNVGYNDNDWSKEKWIQNSVNEDFEFLASIKGAQVNSILALVASNKKA